MLDVSALGYTSVAFGKCDYLSGGHWVSGVRPLKRARILIIGLNEAQQSLDELIT